MTDKPTRGGARPGAGRKPSAESAVTPIRQLGRVPDAEWDALKAAANKAGMPFSQWARMVLLKAARRLK